MWLSCGQWEFLVGVDGSTLSSCWLVLGLAGHSQFCLLFPPSYLVSRCSSGALDCGAWRHPGGLLTLSIQISRPCIANGGPVGSLSGPLWGRVCSLGPQLWRYVSLWSQVELFLLCGGSLYFFHHLGHSNRRWQSWCFHMPCLAWGSHCQWPLCLTGQGGMFCVPELTCFFFGLVGGCGVALGNHQVHTWTVFAVELGPSGFGLSLEKLLYWAGPQEK